MLPGKTLVLGGNGFLGHNFLRHISRDSVIHVTERLNFSVKQDTFLFRIQRDNLEVLIKLIKSSGFDYVINCVANANIEVCELEPEKAFFVNSEIPRLLAIACKESKTQLIHISTDAVFDGFESMKSENSLAVPKTIYGKSKLSGEKSILKENPSALIARVNFFGKSPKNNSIFDFFYNGLSRGIKLSGFTNIYFTPLYVEDTVRAIIYLIENRKSGIFHVTGKERLSKFDFGQKIAKTWGYPVELISPSLYEGEADRPLDLSLDSTKLLNCGIDFPQLDVSLEKLRLKLEKK